MTKRPLNTAEQNQLDAISAQANAIAKLELADIERLLVNVPTNLRDDAAEALLKKCFAQRAQSDSTIDFAVTAKRLKVSIGRVQIAHGVAEKEKPETDTLPHFNARFTFKKPLGAGSYGRVGLFHDNHLHRDVAIKLPRSQQDKTMTHELLSEVRRTCRVQSSRVIQIHDVGWLYDEHDFLRDPKDGTFVAAERPAIVMEYAARGRLHDSLGAPWQLENIAKRFRPMAEGVGDIHDGGFIHSDLKPANILFGGDGLPRIADLGLATAWFKAAPQWLGGTKPYMAPEVLAAFGRLKVAPTRQQDIWSLGVILYELLTGRHPFRNESDWKAKIQTATFVPVQDANPRLGEAWQKVIRGCLDERPERRFGKIVELLDAVDEALHSQNPHFGGGNRKPPKDAAGGDGGGDSSESHRRGGGGDPLDSRVETLFVGHTEDLDWLDEVFGEVAFDAPPLVAVIHALAGMGKTYLIDRWLWSRKEAAKKRDELEPVVTTLALDRKQSYTAEKLRGLLATRFRLSAGDVSLQLRANLANGFLRIENVDSQESLHAVTGLVQELNGCRVIISARSFQKGALPRSWRARELCRLTEEQAEQQFRAELEATWEELPESSRTLLLDRTAGMPLAIHLVTGYLLSGHRADKLTQRLTRLLMLDASDPRRGQNAIQSLAEEAIEALRYQLRSHSWLDGEALLHGFRRLGFALPSGVGLSLAAAIAGLSVDDLDDLLVEARSLHLVENFDGGNRFRIHPLLAEILHDGLEQRPVFAAITDWFCKRLPPAACQPDRQPRWLEIHNEYQALTRWLQTIPDCEVLKVIRSGRHFASQEGPFEPWTQVCLRAASLSVTDEDESVRLAVLASVLGTRQEYESGLAAAREKLELDTKRRDTEGIGAAASTIGEIFAKTGKIDAAIAILRETALPAATAGEHHELTAMIHFNLLYAMFQRGELKAESQTILDELMRLTRYIHDECIAAELHCIIAVVQGLVGDIWGQTASIFDTALAVMKRHGSLRKAAAIQCARCSLSEFRGNSREIIRICRDELLPYYERVQDLREVASITRLLAIHMAQIGNTGDAHLLLKNSVLPVFDRLSDVEEWASTQLALATILKKSGNFAEALHVLRDVLLPELDPIDNVFIRINPLNEIAELLLMLDECDAALNIYLDEVLPSVRKQAIPMAEAETWECIAIVLLKLKRLDESIRIRREELIPLYEQLGQVLKKTVAIGRIADALAAQGNEEEALRIRREEELPVYEQLGERRNAAVTISKIAAALVQQGDLDGAIHMRRERELPHYEQLGDIQGKATTLWEIAEVLQNKKGDLAEAVRIRREELIPLYEQLGQVLNKTVAIGRIADALAAQGNEEEALRIRRDEELPVYEQLGERRNAAVTVSKIAAALVQQGDLDGAIHIRRERELPHYEQLGDIQGKATTLWEIAEVLQNKKGDLVEAVRIRREELIPLFEQLGQVLNKTVAIGRIADALAAQGNEEEALRIRRDEELPVYEQLGERRNAVITVEKIATILSRRGACAEAIRLLQDFALLAYQESNDEENATRIQSLIADLKTRSTIVLDACNILEFHLVFGSVGKASKLRESAEQHAKNGAFGEAIRIIRDEVVPLYQPTNDLWRISEAISRLADLRRLKGELRLAAETIRNEELQHYDRLKLLALNRCAEILIQDGDLDEALRIRRQQELPIYKQLGDLCGEAVTLGKIADMLQYQKSDLDEALRIRRDEELPVYEQLGERRNAAVTVSKIAAALVQQGDLDGAIHIRRERELPHYEQLGDIQGKATTLWEIAEVLQNKKGDLVEAVRIRREEVIPLYEQLGQVVNKTVAIGRIADALAAQGNEEEAFRIRRDEELPVYEQLGERRNAAVTISKIAAALVQQGDLDGAIHIRRERELPHYDQLGDIQGKATALWEIAEVLQNKKGDLNEAIRIRREELVPLYEKLGKVVEKAWAIGRNADALAAQGSEDEALRIRREEELPVYEQLGDIRSKAVTMAKIAEVLRARGELDDALRIYREEVLPVFERLGDILMTAVVTGYVAVLLAKKGDFEEAIRLRRDEELPVYEKLEARHAWLRCQRGIGRFLLQRGDNADRAEAAHRLRIAMQVAFELGVGDVHEIRDIMSEFGIASAD